MTRKEFTLANPTAPSAEQQASAPEASRRRDVQAPRKERLSAFTWKQTEQQQDDLENLLRLARRATGRRVDKRDVLAALVTLATEQDAVRGLLFERLDA